MYKCNDKYKNSYRISFFFLIQEGKYKYKRYKVVLLIISMGSSRSKTDCSHDML